MFITAAEFDRLDYSVIITSVVNLASDITGSLETAFPTDKVKYFDQKYSVSEKIVKNIQ